MTARRLSAPEHAGEGGDVRTWLEIEVEVVDGPRELLAAPTVLPRRVRRSYRRLRFAMADTAAAEEVRTAWRAASRKSLRRWLHET